MTAERQRMTDADVAPQVRGGRFEDLVREEVVLVARDWRGLVSGALREVLPPRTPSGVANGSGMFSRPLSRSHPKSAGYAREPRKTSSPSMRFRQSTGPGSSPPTRSSA
jgi:hypothetical protein